MRRLTAIVLAVVMLSALAACNSGAGTPDPKETSGDGSNAERKVVVGITFDPQTLNPWETQTKGREFCLTTVYQTLAPSIINQETGIMTPNMAMITGWEKTEENTYRVYLREGIHDTAGYPFTAEDVVFCYETAKSIGNHSKVKGIDTVTAIDELTVEFKMGKAMAVGGFEDLLTEIYMVTKESYEACGGDMATKPVGTTGYVIDEYVAGSHITFKKADVEYWNQAANDSKSLEDGYVYLYDTNNVDVVQYDFITDTAMMAIALETGQIDMSISVSSKDLALFEEGGQHGDDFNVFKFPDSMVCLTANCSPESECANINMRYALFHCFDDAACLQASYKGDGILLSTVNTPYKSDYDSAKYSGADDFAYDLDLAREYLDKYAQETGKSLDEVQITILTENKSAWEKMAQVIQASIIELFGRESACTILSLDANTTSTTLTDPSAYDLYIVTGGAEQTYATSFYSKYMDADTTSTGYSGCFIEDAKFQELLKATLAEDTHSVETVNAFQDYLAEQAYYTGVMCGKTYMVAADWVQTLLKGPKACIAVCGLEYDWAAK